MILVRKARMLFYIIAVFIFFIIIAFYSYYIVIRSHIYSYDGLKFHAETIFFIGILFAIIFALFGFRIINRSRKIGRALDMLLVAVRNTGHSPDAGLRKLGKTGIQIADILSELDQTSLKKTVRINSMNTLIKIIMKTYEKNAVVVSAAGNIIYCSKDFAEKYSLSIDQVSDYLLNSFVKDKQIIAKIEEVILSKKEFYSDSLTIFPIVNSSNTVAYCFCIFGLIKKD